MASGVSEGRVALADAAVAHFDGNVVVAERLRRGFLDHQIRPRFGYARQHLLVACTGWIRALGGERVGPPEKPEKPAV